MEIAHFQVSFSMIDSYYVDYKLMYRPPGRENHLNIAEALDEIFNKLDLIESKLQNMELNHANPNETV